jgi:hypothetical protein
LTEATKSRTVGGRPRRWGRAAPAIVALLLLGPVAADAGVAHKNGRYSGKTAQTAVNAPFNQIQFTVKKRRITLTTEPTVARQLCTSGPVFTLDGTPSKKISKRGTFTFSKTFMGNKFDKISGRFVSSKEIQGFAIYHFPQADLCSAGKAKVAFTASHK